MDKEKGPEKYTHLPKDTQLLNGRGRTRDQEMHLSPGLEW